MMQPIPEKRLQPLHSHLENKKIPDPEHMSRKINVTLPEAATNASIKALLNPFPEALHSLIIAILTLIGIVQELEIDPNLFTMERVKEIADSILEQIPDHEKTSKSTLFQKKLIYFAGTIAGKSAKQVEKELEKLTKELKQDFILHENYANFQLALLQIKEKRIPLDEARAALKMQFQFHELTSPEIEKQINKIIDKGFKAIKAGKSFDAASQKMIKKIASLSQIESSIMSRREQFINRIFSSFTSSVLSPKDESLQTAFLKTLSFEMQERLITEDAKAIVAAELRTERFTGELSKAALAEAQQRIIKKMELRHLEGGDDQLYTHLMIGFEMRWIEQNLDAQFLHEAFENYQKESVLPYLPPLVTFQLADEVKGKVLDALKQIYQGKTEQAALQLDFFKEDTDPIGFINHLHSAFNLRHKFGPFRKRVEKILAFALTGGDLLITPIPKSSIKEAIREAIKD